MSIHWAIPGFKGRTFKLCVLTRWDFNFCVGSSPLRDSLDNQSYTPTYYALVWILWDHHHHLCLNRGGRWGTTDNFATSFLYFFRSPLHPGTCRTPGLSIPWCCLPTSSSVCRVFFPFSLCLARPDKLETWPYHCSLRLFMVVRRSSRGPVACWILAWTSS